MEFQRYKLSQLITIKNGKDYKHLEEGDVPVFGSGGYMCSVSSYLYDKVSILLPRKGTLSNIQYFNNGKFWTVDTCFYSIINGSLCNPYYLYRHLRSLDLSGYDTGASIPSMTQKTYNGIKVMLPSLPAQHRIASILSAYDNLIENNNKRIRLLEQMAENLYKEWFVRFRFPGHEKAEFENGLPKGWKYKRADEVILFNPTLKVGKQTGYAIIPMEALSTSSMVLDSDCFEIKETISGRRSQNGDTLFAKITPCLENGKIGFVMGLPEGEVFGGSTEFIVLRSKTLSPYYVYCTARSYHFRQTAILSMNGADGRQRVDEDKLKSYKVVQPAKEDLEKFDRIVSPYFKQILHLTQENQSLSRQRDLLLPRLMSGKLEVKV